RAVEGAAGFSGDNDTAIYAKLNHPTGVAVDSAGNIFIADQMNNRIRMVSPAGIITTVVGNGVATFNTDLQPFPSMVAINKPYSVAVSPSNEVYFADTYNNIIRKYDRANNKVVTVKGKNALLLSLGEGTLSLNKPTCITFDNFANMYIADEGNLVVKKLDSARIYKTVAGSGSFGFSGDGGAALSAKLSAARGLAADGAGNVFISDFYNERVRYYNAPVDVRSTATTAGTFSIFPNPSDNGKFTVNVTVQQPSRMVLNVTDLSGKLVFSKQTETNSPVDVQLKQPSGIYLLQVITDDNFWTGKIEIRN
ncbi:MAG: T9SS type A sorting domain-containing protein, partial [Chitinophagaceae bacterium]|nr:T9SS type A sorting domain-containing protein [Chitinophagaceae bacterium]